MQDMTTGQIEHGDESGNGRDVAPGVALDQELCLRVWERVVSALINGTARIQTTPELAANLTEFFKRLPGKKPSGAAVISDTPCQRCGTTPSVYFEVWYVDETLSLLPMALCEGCTVSSIDPSADRRLFSPERRAAVEQFDREQRERLGRLYG